MNVFIQGSIKALIIPIESLKHSVIVIFSIFSPSCIILIGRHCLPRDVEFAAMMLRNGPSLFTAARGVDRRYRAELQERGE